MSVSAKLSDDSIKYPARMLADAVRERLDDSPSDALPDQPCGTLTVSRAWLPIFKLKDQTAAVITVLPGDDQGSYLDRSRKEQQIDVGVDFSVQQLIQETDSESIAWKQEVDAITDFAQRVLLAAMERTVDEAGSVYLPVSYERTLDDDALRQWNQVSVLFEVQFRSLQ